MELFIHQTKWFGSIKSIEIDFHKYRVLCLITFMTLEPIGQIVNTFTNGKKVVAVEPIKELCSKINKNFKKSIDSGQLKIF